MSIGARASGRGPRPTGKRTAKALELAGLRTMPTTLRFGLQRAGPAPVEVDWFVGDGHTVGMTTTHKIAVSLPKQVADRARRAVQRGHAPSVSAYVTAALEEKAKLDELSTLLSEMLEESGGPMTPAERRAANRMLGVGRKSPSRKRQR